MQNGDQFLIPLRSIVPAWMIGVITSIQNGVPNQIRVFDQVFSKIEQAFGSMNLMVDDLSSAYFCEIRTAIADGTWKLLSANSHFSPSWYLNECIDIKSGNVMEKSNGSILRRATGSDFAKLPINYYISNGLIEVDLTIKKRLPLNESNEKTIDELNLLAVIQQFGRIHVEDLIPRVLQSAEELEKFGFKIRFIDTPKALKADLALENDDIGILFKYDMGDYTYVAEYLPYSKFWIRNHSKLYSRLVPLDEAISSRSGRQEINHKLTPLQFVKSVEKDIRLIAQYASDILEGSSDLIAELQRKHYHAIYEQYGAHSIPSDILRKLEEN